MQTYAKMDYKIKPGFISSGSSKPFKRKSPKIGRNQKCICNSNKKYKKCCMKKVEK